MDCNIESDHEVPKISKILSVIKWAEDFEYLLHHAIGVLMIPLEYVTRAEDTVPT